MAARTPLTDRAAGTALLHDHERSLWSVLALAAIATVVAVAIALPMPSPMFMPDEVAYFERAREMVGNDLATDEPFFPGYSWILVPAVFLGQAVVSDYTAALVTNGILHGSSVLLAYGLALRVGPTARRAALLAAAVLAVYPGWLLYSPLLLSENLLIPVVLGVGLLVAAAAAKLSPTVLATTGSAATLAILVHPRAALLFPAAAGGVAIAGHAHGKVGRTAAWFGVGAAPTFALVAWIIARTTGDLAYGGAGGRVVERLDWASVPDVGVALVGQWFYIGLASLGLAAVGLGVSVGWLWGRGSAPTRRAVGLMSVLLAAGTLFSSALIGGPSGRLDGLFHGRYNDIAVVLPVVMSVVWLCGADRRPRLVASVGGIVASVVVPGAMLAAVHGATRLRGEIFVPDVVGMLFLLIDEGGVSRLSVDVATAVAFSLAVAATMILLARSGWRVVWPVLIGVLLGMSIIGTARFLYPFAEVGRPPAGVLEVLADPGADGCVVVHDPQSPARARTQAAAIRFWTTGVRVEERLQRDARRPCDGWLVVPEGHQPDATWPTATRVPVQGATDGWPWTLWKLEAP